MATLCVRPTDSLAGRAFFGAHRGVPSSRRPMRQQKQQGSQVPATAAPPVAVMQSRPARGQANGRQYSRHSPPAPAASSPPHKLVMENVVILKRGEQQIPPVIALAAAEEHVELAKEEVEREPVAVAGQSRAPADNADPVAAAGQRGRDTQEKKAEAATRRAANVAKAAPLAVAPAHQTVPQQQAKKETKQTHVAATVAAAKLAPPEEAYAGPSFATAAPDPSELPIPWLLLKSRGRAPRTIRASGDDRAPVTMAVAA